MKGVKLDEKKIDAKVTGSEVAVFADRGRIGQVIANLVSNAIKYTDEKGKITIDISKVENNAVGVVEDTGIGISPEEQTRVSLPEKSRGRFSCLLDTPMTEEPSP